MGDEERPIACRRRDSRWSMTIDAGTSEDLEKQLEEQNFLG